MHLILRKRNYVFKVWCSDSLRIESILMTSTTCVPVTKKLNECNASFGQGRISLPLHKAMVSAAEGPYAVVSCHLAKRR